MFYLGRYAKRDLGLWISILFSQIQTQIFSQIQKGNMNSCRITTVMSLANTQELCQVEQSMTNFLNQQKAKATKPLITECSVYKSSNSLIHLICNAQLYQLLILAIENWYSEMVSSFQLWSSSRVYLQTSVPYLSPSHVLVWYI